MNNLYHYNLNLPVEFELTFKDESDYFHTSFDIELINYKFRNWLAERDLQIMSPCERFLLDPRTRSSLPIHIDNPDSPNHVKLNYVFCDTPHTTAWYKLKPEKKLNFSKTAIGTNFAWAAEEDCEPIFSSNVKDKRSRSNAGRRWSGLERDVLEISIDIIFEDCLSIGPCY